MELTVGKCLKSALIWLYSMIEEVDIDSAEGETRPLTRQSPPVINQHEISIQLLESSLLSSRICQS
jgi:hypothetical protein